MFVFLVVFCCILFFFFKQKTAYEMRISDWSSDVCSSDLLTVALLPASYVTGRIELRRLFLIGAAAVGAGLFLIALVPEFWALCVGRALGGAGQGTLLVAVQAYAFSVVGPSQPTRAAAVQVLGHKGGPLVGTGPGGALARESAV